GKSPGIFDRPLPGINRTHLFAVSPDAVESEQSEGIQSGTQCSRRTPFDCVPRLIGNPSHLSNVSGSALRSGRLIGLE
ncbi:MAG: hypothetical protein V3S81_01495, partial [Anaerolineales bacterium]